MQGVGQAKRAHAALFRFDDATCGHHTAVELVQIA
jgi:hypothetical protein